MHISRSAFSLVELSIVLVILGLLTGGILAGQSLIRAAELRSVTREYDHWAAATQTFRDKYFSLPGDMTNATKFWDVDPGGCPGTNATTTVPGSKTCNGDGNGQITTLAANSNEIYRYWQHLANAGLINGSFTGVADSPLANTEVSSTITPNSPASRVALGFWKTIYAGEVPVSSTDFFDGSSGNVLLFTNAGNTGLLTPAEAWNVDTKSDDGRPGTGRVQSRKVPVQAKSDGTGCSDIAYSTAVSIANASSYQLANGARTCTLVFKAGF